MRRPIEFQTRRKDRERRPGRLRQARRASQAHYTKLAIRPARSAGCYEVEAKCGSGESGSYDGKSSSPRAIRGEAAQVRELTPKAVPTRVVVLG